MNALIMEIDSPGYGYTDGSKCALLGSPEMEGGEQEVQLEEAVGRTVNLSCKAVGHPRPSISWTIAGSQVFHFNRSWSSMLFNS